MNESIITWNLPNFITICLMLALLWGGIGIGSNFIRGKSSNKRKMTNGVTSDNSGNLVASE